MPQGTEIEPFSQAGLAQRDRRIVPDRTDIEAAQRAVLIYIFNRTNPTAGFQLDLLKGEARDEVFELVKPLNTRGSTPIQTERNLDLLLRGAEANGDVREDNGAYFLTPRAVSGIEAMRTRQIEERARQIAQEELGQLQERVNAWKMVVGDFSGPQPWSPDYPQLPESHSGPAAK